MTQVTPEVPHEANHTQILHTIRQVIIRALFHTGSPSRSTPTHTFDALHDEREAESDPRTAVHTVDVDERRFSRA